MTEPLSSKVQPSGARGTIGPTKGGGEVGGVKKNKQTCRPRGPHMAAPQCVLHALAIDAAQSACVDPLRPLSRASGVGLGTRAAASGLELGMRAAGSCSSLRAAAESMGPGSLGCRFVLGAGVGAGLSYCRGLALAHSSRVQELAFGLRAWALTPWW